MTDRLWLITKIMYKLIEEKYPDFNNTMHMEARQMAEDELREKSMKELQVIAKEMNVTA